MNSLNPWGLYANIYESGITCQTSWKQWSNCYYRYWDTTLFVWFPWERIVMIIDTIQLVLMQLSCLGRTYYRGLGARGAWVALQERQNKILTTLQSPVLLILNHKHCNHRHTYMNEYLSKQKNVWHINTMNMFLNIFK